MSLVSPLGRMQLAWQRNSAGVSSGLSLPTTGAAPPSGLEEQAAANNPRARNHRVLLVLMDIPPRYEDLTPTAARSTGNRPASARRSGPVRQARPGLSR